MKETKKRLIRENADNWRYVLGFWKDTSLDVVRIIPISFAVETFITLRGEKPTENQIAYLESMLRKYPNLPQTGSHTEQFANSRIITQDLKTRVKSNLTLTSIVAKQSLNIIFTNNEKGKNPTKKPSN